MTLEKAIEALEGLHGLVDEDAEVNYMDALHLGIEALKREASLREMVREDQVSLLPGETKE